MSESLGGADMSNVNTCFSSTSADLRNNGAPHFHKVCDDVLDASDQAIVTVTTLSTGRKIVGTSRSDFSRKGVGAQTVQKDDSSMCVTESITRRRVCAPSQVQYSTTRGREHVDVVRNMPEYWKDSVYAGRGGYEGDLRYGTNSMSVIANPKTGPLYGGFAHGSVTSNQENEKPMILFSLDNTLKNGRCGSGLIPSTDRDEVLEETLARMCGGATSWSVIRFDAFIVNLKKMPANASREPFGANELLSDEEASWLSQKFVLTQKPIVCFDMGDSKSSASLASPPWAAVGLSDAVTAALGDMDDEVAQVEEEKRSMAPAPTPVAPPPPPELPEDRANRLLREERESDGSEWPSLTEMMTETETPPPAGP